MDTQCSIVWAELSGVWAELTVVWAELTGVWAELSGVWAELSGVWADWTDFWFSWLPLLLLSPRMTSMKTSQTSSDGLDEDVSQSAAAESAVPMANPELTLTAEQGVIIAKKLSEVGPTKEGLVGSECSLLCQRSTSTQTLKI